MTRLHLEVNFGQKNMQVILVFSNIEFLLLNILISVSKHWIFVRRITLCISYKVLLLKTDLHKFTIGGGSYRTKVNFLMWTK